MHNFVEVALEASIFAHPHLNINDSVIKVDLETDVFVDFDGPYRKRSLVNDYFILDFNVKSEVLVEESDDVMDSKTVEDDNRLKRLLHFSLLFCFLWQGSQQLFVKDVILSSSEA